MKPESFPQIDLFPRVTKVAEFVRGLVRHLPESGFPSSHAGFNYDQVQTEGFLYTGEQLEFPDGGNE